MHIGLDSVVTGTVIVDYPLHKLVLVVLHLLESVIKHIHLTAGFVAVAGHLDTVQVDRVQ